MAMHFSGKFSHDLDHIQRMQQELAQMTALLGVEVPAGSSGSSPAHQQQQQQQGAPSDSGRHPSAAAAGTGPATAEAVSAAVHQPAAAAALPSQRGGPRAADRCTGGSSSGCDPSDYDEMEVGHFIYDDHMKFAALDYGLANIGLASQQGDQAVPELPVVNSIHVQTGDCGTRLLPPPQQQGVVHVGPGKQQQERLTDFASGSATAQGIQADSMAPATPSSIGTLPSVRRTHPGPRRSSSTSSSYYRCCDNCGIDSTTVQHYWRRDPDDNTRVLCNACGVYKLTNGYDRPRLGKGRLLADRTAELEVIRMQLGGEDYELPSQADMQPPALPAYTKGSSDLQPSVVDYGVSAPPAAAAAAEEDPLKMDNAWHLSTRIAELKSIRQSLGSQELFPIGDQSLISGPGLQHAHLLTAYSSGNSSSGQLEADSGTTGPGGVSAAAVSAANAAAAAAGAVTGPMFQPAANPSSAVTNRADDHPAAAAAVPRRQLKQRRRQRTENRQCANCSTPETSNWRKDPDEPARVLCNACGLYKVKNYCDRPLTLAMRDNDRDSKLAMLMRQAVARDMAAAAAAGVLPVGSVAYGQRPDGIPLPPQRAPQSRPMPAYMRTTAPLAAVPFVAIPHVGAVQIVTALPIAVAAPAVASTAGAAAAVPAELRPAEGMAVAAPAVVSTAAAPPRGGPAPAALAPAVTATASAGHNALQTAEMQAPAAAAAPAAVGRAADAAAAAENANALPSVTMHPLAANAQQGCLLQHQASNASQQMDVDSTELLHCESNIQPSIGAVRVHVGNADGVEAAAPAANAAPAGSIGCAAAAAAAGVEQFLQKWIAQGSD